MPAGGHRRRATGAAMSWICARHEMRTPRDKRRIAFRIAGGVFVAALLFPPHRYYDGRIRFLPVYGVSRDQVADLLYVVPPDFVAWGAIIFAIVLLTGLAMFLLRDWPRGHCQRCGYDLRGHATLGSVCSECGYEPSSES